MPHSDSRVTEHVTVQRETLSPCDKGVGLGMTHARLTIRVLRTASPPMVMARVGFGTQQIKVLWPPDVGGEIVEGSLHRTVLVALL